MKNKTIIPNAPILVESTRSVGYSFESALADIIDNSIGMGATHIDVLFDCLEEPFIAIIDNACGMLEHELIQAMQYGSKSFHDERDKNDLGRFGLGLKMASLSQCRCLTVISKKNNCISAARWDLDHIIKEDNWSLILYEENEVKVLKFFERLSEFNSGTIVIWENFDKIIESTNDFQKTFNMKIEEARNHVALVFHRFMGDENIIKKVKIYFNNLPIVAIDPFLIDNPATQPLAEQSIILNENQIKVKPYILPHVSKLKNKDKVDLGDMADIRYNQGFYVYRNRRLIIWGTWFRLRKNYELNKLARIRVDIPNTLDSIWQIDIKKSTASLPDMIKRNLIRIVEEAVGKSERVYKYRGRKINDDNFEHIWNVIDDRGCYRYEINRNISLINELNKSLGEKELCYFHSLLRLIEDFFPFSDVYYRMAKNGEESNLNKMSDDEAFKIAIDLIESIKESGMNLDIFLQRMDCIDLFIKYPNISKKIKEMYGNE